MRTHESYCFIQTIRVPLLNQNWMIKFIDFPAVDLGARKNALRDWKEILRVELSVVHRYYIDLPVSGLYSAACFSAVPFGPSPRDHRDLVSRRSIRIRGFSSPVFTLIVVNHRCFSR